MRERLVQRDKRETRAAGIGRLPKRKCRKQQEPVPFDWWTRRWTAGLDEQSDG